MSQDLNKIMLVVQNDGKELEAKMKELLIKYDDLYRQGNRQYIEERNAAGSNSGLEDFFILVQTIRRNRDVMGSLLRGISNLRNLSKYKFVEQDIPEPSVRQKKSRRKLTQSVKLPEPVQPPDEGENING